MHTMAGGRGSPKGFPASRFIFVRCIIVLVYVFVVSRYLLLFLRTILFWSLLTIWNLWFFKKKTEIVRAARLGVAVFLLRYIKRAIRNLSSILP